MFWRGYYGNTEKIKQIRQEKKMSREELHQKLMDILGKCGNPQHHLED